jgi:hypothetical protein
MAEEREAEAPEEKAAEKKADEAKSPAGGYVKVKLEVELRGVLSCADEAITISIDKKDKWVLDFGEDKEMREKAKGLDGKTVLVKGSAILRGIQSKSGLEYREETQAERAMRKGAAREPHGIRTKSVLDLEPKIAVKSLVAATKE